MSGLTIAPQPGCCCRCVQLHGVSLTESQSTCVGDARCGWIGIHCELSCRGINRTAGACDVHGIGSSVTIVNCRNGIRAACGTANVSGSEFPLICKCSTTCCSDTESSRSSIARSCCRGLRGNRRSYIHCQQGLVGCYRSTTTRYGHSVLTTIGRLRRCYGVGRGSCTAYIGSIFAPLVGDGRLSSSCYREVCSIACAKCGSNRLCSDCSGRVYRQVG